jgi:hypothetical protein
MTMTTTQSILCVTHEEGDQPELIRQMMDSVQSGVMYDPNAKDSKPAADWLEFGTSSPNEYNDNAPDKQGPFGLWCFGGPTIRLWFFETGTVAVCQWGFNHSLIVVGAPNHAMRSLIGGQ